MALRETLLHALPTPLKTTLKPVGQLCVEGYIRYSQLDDVSAWLAAHPHLRGLNFVDGALDFLNARPLIDPDELARIPREGAALMVANHPLGALDALLLLKLVGERRSDVKILANLTLEALTGLKPLLIPVTVWASAAGERVPARERTLDALRRGELVIVFPGAEVSRLTARGIRDPRWHPGVVGLARASGAQVLPVHVGGRLSWPFYLGSLAFKSLGTAMLPRELMRARGARLPVRIGLPIAVGDAPIKQELSRIRQRIESLPRAEAGSMSADVPAAPIDRLVLKRAVESLECVGTTTEGRSIYVGRPGLAAPLLRELARLRELAFRAVGEGSGARYDWDRFDEHYTQLILWDSAALEIAGAYRLCPTRGLRIDGLADTLYSATLFEFTKAFAPLLGAGCELGRSFVQPRYWHSRSLDELWCGIGAWLNREPGIRYLFGPVSASAALGASAQKLIAEHYVRHYPSPEPLARAKRPLIDGALPPPLDTDAAYALLKANLAALGAKVPMLFRQYSELCEPGGVRFLDFSVDPQFAGCVDGLILLDLAQMKPKKRARYFGDAGHSARICSI
jgi:putative hemolysin